MALRRALIAALLTLAVPAAAQSPAPGHAVVAPADLSAAPAPPADAPAADAPPADAPAPDAPAAAPAADDPAATEAARGQARALVDALRDEGARAALIAELERIGAAPAVGPPGADPAALQAEGDLSAGRWLAMLARETAEELGDAAEGFVNGLAATQRRLSALWQGDRPELLFEALSGLGAVVLTTVVGYALLRAALRPLLRRLGAVSAASGLIRRVWLGAAAAALDLLAVLAAALLGYVVTFALFYPADALTENQALYLNAFVVVEVVKAAIHAVLAPHGDRLRLAPLTDAGARYWSGRLGGIVTLLGYGLMLLTPIIDQTVSIFTGRAVAVLIYAAALLWAMGLVVRHRRAPTAWLAARAEAEGGDPTLRILAAFAAVWHWPALLWLVSVFVIAVSRSGAVTPVLATTGSVALVIVAGGVASALAARGARQGVRLPPRVAAASPLLEGRLNGFLLRFLGALRFLIFVFTIGASLRVAGVVDLRAVMARALGYDLATSIFDIAVTAVLGFAIWLAVASWVDYRLNPERAVAPTAREQTLLTLLRNAATVAIVLVAGMSILSNLGLDVAPLIASAGVVGLAVGFGAQRLVQDVITGIFIQFENAINVGDVVTVGGVTGTVEKLTIRSVSLRDVAGVFHIIPFSTVDMVSNFNRGFAFHVADLGVAYDTDLTAAKAAVLAAFDDVKADPAFGRSIIGPIDWHGVTMFGDSAITLRARIRTRPGAQWAVGRAFNEAVKRRFDAAGVEIPFPQTTMWIKSRDGGEGPLDGVEKVAAEA